ncbi:hypothetical protein SEA_TUNATARTARE_69 [Streptomyces phage TunaTartare]|uniref:Uncharacterized protein n=1 Tax=Streptomyces phage TunaTartare TaxID=2848887 RepID=A0A8F2IWI0_9CAUD|nr:hypothetical protein PP457_gp181 [Streptomyces phage TunaTartare]QWT29961.1 hypothetical protein SEA_TUNATARTARE_69 [Streptomyces phage TunaTartare]
MRFVAKPVETNAWQFDGNNWGLIKSVVGHHQIDEDAYMDNFIRVEEMWVDIPEGITALVWVEPSKQWAGVKPGDYIVEDADGNFYPCERSIFERKYDPVVSQKVEINVSGVVTTEQISRAVGNRIQQSRRFQG